jgi:hypothetical protein
MVSVVFDKADSPASPAVQGFIKQTHDQIDSLLEPLRERIRSEGRN